METVQEDKVLADASESLEQDVIPVPDDVGTESENEQLSESGNFQRGNKRTMSLDRSYKSRSASPSMLSLATKRVRNLFGLKADKDLHKTLQNKEVELENVSGDLQLSVTENEKLKSENRQLKDENNEHKKEITKLQKENDRLQEQEKGFLSSMNQMLETYDRKFARLDCEAFEPVEKIKKVDNLLIGSGNMHVHNISTIDMDGLNKLLLQYHENLEYVMQEWNQTKYSLEMAKSLQEQLNNQLLDLKNVQKEVIEAVLDVKETKKELSTELDYSLSWTDPRLMAQCVEELGQLTERTDNYTFKDLTGKAQVGVLRIYRKYEKRMNFKRFVQVLEMEGIVGKDRMSVDIPLQKDDCAALLVKWVQMHEENNADALLERFPKIIAGRSGTRFDKTNVYYANSFDSLSSNDERVVRMDNLTRQWFTQEMKETVHNEVSMLLEEIKKAIDEKRAETLFV